MRLAGTSIWRNRDVSLLVGGATINNTGDWLLELALPLFVYSATGSGITTSAVYLVFLGVSALLGPFGGRLADSLPLKSTLVTTNLLQILALAPLLTVTEERIWPVFVAAVLQGTISSVNDPAAFALLPRLVEDEQLVAANSAMSAAFAISRLVGAAAGGFAVEFGGMTAVAIADGATFAVGATAAALLSPAANVRPESGDSDGADRSVRAGIDAVRTTPGLKPMMSIAAISSTIFGGFSVLFIVFVTEYLGGSEGDVGIIRASSAFGAMLGAAVVGTIASKITPVWLLSGGYLLFGVMASLFINAPPFTTAIWVYMVLYGATGFPNTAAGVGTQSTLQTITPPAFMGRVGGLTGTIFNVGMGLGAIGAGLLLEITTARVILNTQAAMLFLCGVIGVLFVVPVARSAAHGTSAVAKAEIAS